VLNPKIVIETILFWPFPKTALFSQTRVFREKGHDKKLFGPLFINSALKKIATHRGVYVRSFALLSRPPSG
jgi:hypothetical protein